jgi:hypothetical protein
MILFFNFQMFNNIVIDRSMGWLMIIPMTPLSEYSQLNVIIWARRSAFFVNFLALVFGEDNFQLGSGRSSLGLRKSDTENYYKVRMHH